MNPTDFSCLDYFENPSYCIIEIKRKDLPPNADLSEIFRWLFMDKANEHFSSLTFRSMDSSGEIQERFFDQGYLKFNNENATYIEKFNFGQHHLENKTGLTPPIQITEAIASYIK